MNLSNSNINGIQKNQSMLLCWCVLWFRLNSRLLQQLVLRGESSLNAQEVTDRLSEQMLFSLRELADVTSLRRSAATLD